MRADLKRLKRDTESSRVSGVKPTAPEVRLRKQMYWIAAALVMASVAVFGGWSLYRRTEPSTVSAAQTAVAVLPFQKPDRRCGTRLSADRSLRSSGDSAQLRTFTSCSGRSVQRGDTRLLTPIRWSPAKISSNACRDRLDHA